MTGTSQPLPLISSSHFLWEHTRIYSGFSVECFRGSLTPGKMLSCSHFVTMTFQFFIHFFSYVPELASFLSQQGYVLLAVLCHFGWLSMEQHYSRWIMEYGGKAYVVTLHPLGWTPKLLYNPAPIGLDTKIVVSLSWPKLSQGNKSLLMFTNFWHIYIAFFYNMSLQIYGTSKQSLLVVILYRLITSSHFTYKWPYLRLFI